jgi:hypothetical protein
MLNQLFSGTPTSRRQVTLPNAVTSGEAILVGVLPGFALDNWQSIVSGATVLFNGSFFANVTGQTAESPQTTHKIGFGDALYATGTTDGTTNVTYNLTIDANSNNTPFGNLDPSPQGGGPVLAGATQSVGVFIHG